MSSSEGWSLTESDPGIFTGILNELGVKGLEVEELFSFDMLPELHPVKALIFLFKWVGQGDTKPDGTLKAPEVPHYFAQQVITNACGSLAILNAALNIEGVELGDELANLKAFSEGLDSETCGYTITNSERIRTVHNSFARSDPYHLEENRPQNDDEDAYHFIAYLPIGDSLYELDGLKPAPVSHGVIPGGRGNWTALARTVIERRIATYAATEVHFNLMAICSRSAYLEQEVERLMAGAAASGGSDAWVQEQLEDAKSKLARVHAQFKEWEVDNALRRHNFIGMIHAALLELAKQKKLRPQINAAKELMRKRIEEQRAKGKTGEDLMEED